MARLGRKAREFIREHIDEHLEAVDAAPLHNAITDADDGAPETLHHLATAAEASYFAADCERDRNRDDPVSRKTDAALGGAVGALEDYIDELVAQECANVIQTVDEWEWPDDEQAAASKREAREWLQLHLDAARRAGVLENISIEVSA